MNYYDYINVFNQGINRALHDIAYGTDSTGANIVKTGYNHFNGDWTVGDWAWSDPTIFENIYSTLHSVQATTLGAGRGNDGSITFSSYNPSINKDIIINSSGIALPYTPVSGGYAGTQGIDWLGPESSTTESDAVSINMVINSTVNINGNSGYMFKPVDIKINRLHIQEKPNLHVWIKISDESGYTEFIVDDDNGRKEFIHHEPWE